jgi:hypothetical protein
VRTYFSPLADECEERLAVFIKGTCKCLFPEMRALVGTTTAIVIQS